MLFKLDENMPEEVANLLRQKGHDVSTVIEQGLGGQPDAKIASICAAERRAILTLDLDFADIRVFPPAGFAGLIVMRPVMQNVAILLQLTERMLSLLETQPVEGCLWVVDSYQVRIRGEGPATT